MKVNLSFSEIWRLKLTSHRANIVGRCGARHDVQSFLRGIEYDSWIVLHVDSNI